MFRCLIRGTVEHLTLQECVIAISFSCNTKIQHTVQMSNAVQCRGKTAQNITVNVQEYVLWKQNIPQMCMVQQHKLLSATVVN